MPSLKKRNKANTPEGQQDTKGRGLGFYHQLI